MTKSIIVRLVVPLACLTALSLLFQNRLDADDLLLNLTSEFVGIIIPVGYVDWILKEHDRQVWRGTSERVDLRLRTLAHSAITGIRSEFGFGAEFFDRLIEKRNDINAISGEVKRVALEQVSPAIRGKLDDIDTDVWKRLAHHLESVSRNVEQLIVHFGPRLGAKDMELLLDLQQAAESSLTFWRTFPDIAGVEDSRLPPTSGNTVEFKSAFNDMTADSLREVLNLSAKILDLCSGRVAA